MANQYTGNFEQVIKSKFGISAKEMLKQCADQGLSYPEAGERLGFKHGTIRKWANKYDIQLNAGEPETLKSDEFLALLRSEQLNQYNILSRSWLPSNYPHAYLNH
jgi:hypothetical protein